MKRWMFLGLAAIAALLWLACAGGEEAPPAATPAPEAEEEGFVDVVLNEWSITDEETGATSLSAQAGDVAFEAHNEGAIPHELVVIKTDTPPDALPVSGGKVDEEAAGEEIGEIEEFPGGETQVGTFNLTAGKYALICNIAGHYEQGMYAELTVE